MTAATLIYLAGRECELRDVSASAYLSAKAEAAEIAGKRGTDGGDEALIFAACLTAKGLFADGERVFQNGEEALDGLSAKEIAFAAAEYVADVPKISPPENEDAAVAVRPAEAQTAEVPVMSVSMRPAESELVPAFGAKYGFMPEAAEREEDEEVYVIRESAAEPPQRARMRETSDFFRRDSRRYDGEFERY